MNVTYYRTVRLSDTDAAGVVYFAQVMSMCHEAYEESLAVAGVNLKDFLNNSPVAIPVVHASVDFFRPMFCGDKLIIKIMPQQLSQNEFAINYQIRATDLPETCLAKATTRHVCINVTDRRRTQLPEQILQWLNILTMSK